MAKPAIDPISHFVGSTTKALELMTQSLELIHKRIDDHINNEEEEQRRTSDLLASIDKKLEDKFKVSDLRHEKSEEKWNYLIWTVKWVFPVLMFLWPMLVPLFQNFLLDLLNIKPEALLTFHSALTFI